MFTFDLRSQSLEKDANGRSIWQTRTEPRTSAPGRTAIIVCDVWDNHWCRGAAERVDAMVGRMNQVLVAARDRGAHILHAPSDTISFYADSPARQRMLALPEVTIPTDQPHNAPPLPIDDSDRGSDTGETLEQRMWSRQHQAIYIDQDRDGITDDGREVYRYLQHYGIEQLFIMGVHTNMCILNRSFGIKQMTRWNVNIALVRDLTDAMYNPAQAPYVSHDEGTALVIGYIEKFWSPSIGSAELMRTRP